jgi:hypothetical protein
LSQLLSDLKVQLAKTLYFLTNPSKGKKEISFSFSLIQIKNHHIQLNKHYDWLTKMKLKGIDLNSKPTMKLAANLDEAMPPDIK